MSTKMTDTDWDNTLQVFRASLPRRGAKGRNDRLFLEAEAYGIWTPMRGAPNPKGVSELRLLVRCDRQVRSEYFLYVMFACNEVGIYKVNVAAKQTIQE